MRQFSEQLLLRMYEKRLARQDLRITGELFGDRLDKCSLASTARTGDEDTGRRRSRNASGSQGDRGKGCLDVGMKLGDVLIDPG